MGTLLNFITILFKTDFILTDFTVNWSKMFKISNFKNIL